MGFICIHQSNQHKRMGGANLRGALSTEIMPQSQSIQSTVCTVYTEVGGRSDYPRDKLADLSTKLQVLDQRAVSRRDSSTDKLRARACVRQ